jgi:hypothetical protein
MTEKLVKLNGVWRLVSINERCVGCDGNIPFKDLIIRLVLMHRECFFHEVLKEQEKESKRE